MSGITRFGSKHNLNQKENQNYDNKMSINNISNSLHSLERKLQALEMDIKSKIDSDFSDFRFEINNKIYHLNQEISKYIIAINKVEFTDSKQDISLEEDSFEENKL